MDFEELWQRHRVFILLVLAGGLLLLVGLGVKGALYGEPTRRLLLRERALLRDLRRLARITPGDVRDLEEAVRACGKQLATLQARLAVPVPERFRLPAANPKGHYATTVQATREAVAEVASARNVPVPWGLGLPPVTPNSRDEMTQYLRGLHVVERLVTAALATGVRRVDALEVKPSPPGGFLRETQVRAQLTADGPALLQFLDRLADGDAPLPVTFLRVAPPARGHGVAVTVRVSLLDIDPEKPLAEEGGAP